MEKLAAKKKKLSPVGVKKYSSNKEAMKDVIKTLEKLHADVLQSKGGKK